jgi:predicted small metal-binding protein
MIIVGRQASEGKDDNEVVQKAGQHAKTAHNMSTTPPDVEKKARGAIRDVK